MLKNIPANVLSPDRKADEFGILAGFLQGDCLASYLFTINIDYVMHKATSEGENSGFTISKRRS